MAAAIPQYSVLSLDCTKQNKRAQRQTHLNCLLVAGCCIVHKLRLLHVGRGAGAPRETKSIQKINVVDVV